MIDKEDGKRAKLEGNFGTALIYTSGDQNNGLFEFPDKFDIVAQIPSEID
jgi:hypothetical protein